MFSDMEMIWRRIENEVTYPLDFVLGRIEGSVHIEFSLSEEGELENIFSINGENNLLNAYSASRLIHAFVEKLPRKIKEKKRIYACRFQFSIIFSELDREKRELAHFKNILTIERKVLAESPVNEKIGYLWNRLPIKPTPLGPMLDFTAIYQLYGDQSRHDPEWSRVQRLLQNVELWGREVERFQHAN